VGVSVPPAFASAAAGLSAAKARTTPVTTIALCFGVLLPPVSRAPRRTYPSLADEAGHSTFSCDIAYSDSPAASRASPGPRNDRK
jgi:hypothetical protein